MDLSQYAELFLAESREHVSACNHLLLDWERTPAAAELDFTHPITGAKLALRSEWPADLRPALAEAAGDSTLLAERNPLQYLGFALSDG